jgi:hypothetical protein|tara:strand:+ start:466 stop:612 length:147 start_codon:yes stop_codon:yes gene_type:complete
MSMAALIIIIQFTVPFEMKINFEDMEQCQTALANFYSRLPVTVRCEEI